MINCDYENFGCNGGYMIPAIDFLMTEGTTSYDCLAYQNKHNACYFKCDNPKKTY